MKKSRANFILRTEVPLRTCFTCSQTWLSHSQYTFKFRTWLCCKMRDRCWGSQEICDILAHLTKGSSESSLRSSQKFTSLLGSVHSSGGMKWISWPHDTWCMYVCKVTFCEWKQFEYICESSQSLLSIHSFGWGLGGSVGESAHNVGDLLDRAVGRSWRRACRASTPVHSCLRMVSMDRSVWWVTVHVGLQRAGTRLSD